METVNAGASEEVSLEELVTLGATDSLLYARAFFPKTVRQASPHMHREMWEALESPARYVSFMVFRGGAKTTIFRLYISKRIAYCLSRTILVVGKSQDHARRSVEWLMRQVEFNSLWATAFRNLKKLSATIRPSFKRSKTFMNAAYRTPSKK